MATVGTVWESAADTWTSHAVMATVDIDMVDKAGVGGKLLIITKWMTTWENVVKKQGIVIFETNALRLYMCHWTGSALFQLMACRLFGAITWTNDDLLSIRPLQTIFSDIFVSKLRYFHWRNCIWKYRLPKWQPFVSPQYVKMRYGGILHQPSESKRNSKMYFNEYIGRLMSQGSEPICC